MNPLSLLQSEKKLVDVTGIEPVTPCLQRTGVFSNSSVHYFGFQCFQQFGNLLFAQR